MDPKYEKFNSHIADFIKEDPELLANPARCLTLLGVSYFNLCQALKRDPFDSMGEIVTIFTEDFQRRVREENGGAPAKPEEGGDAAVEPETE